MLFCLHSFYLVLAIFLLCKSIELGHLEHSFYISKAMLSE